MGLFGSKKPSGQAVSADDAAGAADQVFDQQYRDELRLMGREHFKRLLDDNSVNFKEDIDATMAEVATDLKEHMKRQLDITIAGINTEITNQLNERIHEFSQLTAEAQDQAAQSLNRNAQAVHNKYQQFSATLQQTIASQEVMMITLFEESKTRTNQVHAEQDKALASMQHNAEESSRKADELHQTLKDAINDQSTKLNTIYEHNLSRVETAKQAQDQAIATLNTSVEELQKKHQDLSDLLDKSVASQKAMLVEAINDNMARILEHYLIGALGEQTHFKAQLPSIIEQLEKNKQAMMDDMKL